MCWLGCTSEEQKKRLAYEDIPVLKVLEKEVDGDKYLSPYFRYVYEFGVLYKSEISTSLIDDCLNIEDGLHSYSKDCHFRVEKGQTGSVQIKIKSPDNHEFLGWYGSSYYYTPVLMNCIIPEGSVYYENSRGEIVSNQLRVIGEVDTK